ncbi:MAG: hypothetical protein AB7K35_13550 [Pseudorhodoplanes sp.]
MTVRCIRPAGLLAALAFGVLPISPLRAQDMAATSGTATQRHACESDAIALCGEFIPNVPAIEACLKRKVKTLSPACRTAVSGATVRKPRSASAVH